MYAQAEVYRPSSFDKFRNAAAWTLKVAGAVLGIVAGLATAFYCTRLVIRPDQALIPILQQTHPPAGQSQSGGLSALRFFTLMIGLGGLTIAQHCGEIIEDWYRVVFERRCKKSRLDAENERLLAELLMAREMQERAEIELANMNGDYQDLCIVLASPAVRRAVLNCWHPDKATTEKDKVVATEAFKLADEIFKRLGS